MRLFIGIFPPKEILDQLRDTIRKYNKFKRHIVPYPIDQLHITLKHLGPQISFESRDKLVEKFKSFEGNFGKPEIKIKNVQWGFKKEDFPKYLHAKVEDSKDLLATANVFHEIVKDLRLEDTVRWKNKFSNSFHITLAKLRSTSTRSASVQVRKFTRELLPKEFPPFIATEVYLVESIPNYGQRPQYRKLESFKL